MTCFVESIALSFFNFIIATRVVSVSVALWTLSFSGGFDFSRGKRGSKDMKQENYFLRVVIFC